MTVFELYKIGLSKLQQAQIETPKYDCDLLLSHSLKKDLNYRHVHSNSIVKENEIAIFNDVINRRANHEPLQYIIGEWSFYGRNFSVGKGVLIPRPETEQLCEFAIQEIKKQKNPIIYDLCAGSGAIGLTIALECPNAFVYLFEKYDLAFSYLKKNKEKLQVNNAELIKEDILMPHSFSRIKSADFLISNPPYIPTKELLSLQDEVKQEPQTALDGGQDGLKFYRTIQSVWLEKLNRNATLFFECGNHQSQDICQIFKDFSANQAIYNDFNMVDRIVMINV